MKKYVIFGILAACFSFYLTTLVHFSSQPDLLEGMIDEASQTPAKNYTSDEIYYHTHVQPILTQRCAVCHSCSNAPCQMNFASYEGFLRGANKHFIYDFAESNESPLTRIGVDEQTIDGWRKKDFFPIYDPTNPEASIITTMINMKTDSSKLPVEIVRNAGSCPANMSEMKQYMAERPDAGMPYGLPLLSTQEKSTLTTWLSNGARGPAWDKIQGDKRPSGELMPQIEQWEAFLNTQTPKNKLVSRYLFEHLFLAHLYFPEKPTEFYSLVRSKNVCSTGIDVISSRRPTDDPGIDNFFYCFQKLTAQIVDKTHIPYLVSSQKLQHVKDLFFGLQWDVKKLPTYDSKLSANPFIIFHDIPVKARYQFLLDDAQYEVNTFIKGPVCFGNSALNSIDEQFYTFFIKPDSDFSSNDPNFESQIEPNLFLPFYYDGSQVPLKGVVGIYGDMVHKRELYRKQIAQKYREKFPRGYSINDLWDGEKTNDNAVLTIMRHQDSATVLKGARGDLSKTAFVLDYPLFERLVYDLVVGYDVFGNIGHQVISRIYMDFIRMEAEENYLLFMPPNDVRKKMRKYWYRGTFADLKMKFWYQHHNLDVPTQVQYKDPQHAQAEFTEQVLFNYMSPQVRGPIDLINWKHINAPANLAAAAQNKLSAQEQSYSEKLRDIASVKGKEKPFSVFFPDLAFLQIKGNNDKNKTYTLVHNREHFSLAIITLEDTRRDPSIDSLNIYPGYVGSFPNMFFSVNENDLNSFVSAVQKIQKQNDYDNLVNKWGISRTNENFWSYSDWFFKDATHSNPADSGLFDLTRYGNDVSERSVNKFIKEATKENSVNEDDEDRSLNYDN